MLLNGLKFYNLGEIVAEDVNIKRLFEEFRSPVAKVTGIGSVREWIKSRRKACEEYGKVFRNLEGLTEDFFADF